MSATTKESVVIRFAGDSGDGMQMTGTQFTETAALAGNDLATFPDYPAEIRAPAGTLGGVSGFQVHFSSDQVFTPGDELDVLVAMNPAALRANLADVAKGGIIIIDTASFSAKNIERANYETDPREDGSLQGYVLQELDITDLTLKSVSEFGLPNRSAKRCKNMFALGLVYWMFGRSVEHTESWLQAKFGTKNPTIRDANIKALKAGFYYGETHEIFSHQYEVAPAKVEPGIYRNISGNEALAYGLIAASERSGLSLFYSGYPITPASPLLHHLAAQKALGVQTFQAEDEIAGICAALGAAYAGSLAVTASSGPGIALKQEAVALALTLELPLVIVNVQRAGPSTGMPTKTEQADLNQAIFGRHGEGPLPVVAAQSPGDCFWAAIEAARLAIERMTPVILLTDGYIANGAEPWRIPDIQSIPRISVPRPEVPKEGQPFLPYARDEQQVRKWSVPGMAGLEHRIGGLEKAEDTGNISYDPDNHQRMTRVRDEKVERIADSYDALQPFGSEQGTLLVGWGGTFGALRKATAVALSEGKQVAHLHLRNLHPLPNDLGDVLSRYKNVVVAELNLGQLRHILRGDYLVDAHGLNKIKGKPFRVSEILSALERVEAGESIARFFDDAPTRPATRGIHA